MPGTVVATNVNIPVFLTDSPYSEDLWTISSEHDIPLNRLKNNNVSFLVPVRVVSFLVNKTCLEQHEGGVNDDTLLIFGHTHTDPTVCNGCWQSDNGISINMFNNSNNPTVVSKPNLNKSYTY